MFKCELNLKAISHKKYEQVLIPKFLCDIMSLLMCIFFYDGKLND